MLDCLLAFLTLCVVLVPDRFGDDEGGEEGPGSIAEEASPPPPPPPPPAAKAGVSEDAVFIATRNVANVPSLITSLIIRASCLRVRTIPPAAGVNSASLDTFPRRIFVSAKLRIGTPLNGECHYADAGQWREGGETRVFHHRVCDSYTVLFRRLTLCPARRAPAACRNWRPSAVP